MFIIIRLISVIIAQDYYYYYYYYQLKKTIKWHITDNPISRWFELPEFLSIYTHGSITYKTFSNVQELNGWSAVTVVHCLHRIFLKNREIFLLMDINEFDKVARHHNYYLNKYIDDVIKISSWTKNTISIWAMTGCTQRNNIRYRYPYPYSNIDIRPELGESLFIAREKIEEYGTYLFRKARTK